MNRRHTITLGDIAKKLDVSKVTVSKALRGHSDIPKETAERVKKVAKQLGYSPNYMARNLSSKKSNTIGVVIPKIAHSFFGAVIESIYDAAFYNNYEIILTVSQENAQREAKHIESLLAMRVDGLIISVSQETRSKAIFSKVKKLGVPLLFMDRVMNVSGTSQVTVDDEGGAFKAIELAIKNGYKKIAHIGGYQNINIGKSRYRGFEKAMEKYGVKINPKWVVFGGFGEENGNNGFKKIYESGELPEFVFAATYPVALGVYAAVAEVGLKIPDDIDIICFGNSEVNRFIKPSLSYVNQSTEQLGRTSVELIIDHIKNYENYIPKHIEIPTELIIQETCIAKKKLAEV